MELAFDKIDHLRELVSQRLINLDFQQIGPAPFHSRIRSIVGTPNVRAVRWSHSPGFTFRDQALVRDGDESLSLVYPENCTITVSHLGQEKRVTPGHSILVRHDAVGRIGAGGNCRYVALVLARSAFERATLADNRLLAECWSSHSPALKLLRTYVSLLAVRNEPMADGLAAAAARHVTDLIALAANEVSMRRVDNHDSAIVGARLEIALAGMRKEFRDPGLSALSVAAAQGISPRYLHRLFEQAGIRFTDFVNELRLDAARAALAEKSDLPIAVLALNTGFSDIAHFNRLFKKRFGMTPSAARNNRSGS
ncbi:MAG: helix-turn-helix transcriptional regulator [Pseudorhodoplanes sp.]|uniref:helix-turn-helix transcriptional regulator n=1 Tax=Pseudorhodoplanes sp. TaxID=1934341 RepID=UPI003D0BE5D9